MRILEGRRETYATYACVGAKLLQLRPTLCYPMECSLPGSSVVGILQARILEWVAMPSSRGSAWPRDQTPISYISCMGRWVLYHYRHLGTLIPPTPCIKLEVLCILSPNFKFFVVVVKYISRDNFPNFHILQSHVGDHSLWWMVG